MQKDSTLVDLILVLLIVSNVLGVSQGQLRVGFYSKTCPNAESIIRKVVQKTVANSPRNAAIMLRLQFHDCFVEVSIYFSISLFLSLLEHKQNNLNDFLFSWYIIWFQGCDGSILIKNDADDELKARGNLGVLGFDIIESAKALLENLCPGIVSCADIVALAARDAVSLVNSH